MFMFLLLSLANAPRLWAAQRGLVPCATHSERELRERALRIVQAFSAARTICAFGRGRRARPEAKPFCAAAARRKFHSNFARASYISRSLIASLAKGDDRESHLLILHVVQLATLQEPTLT